MQWKRCPSHADADFEETKKWQIEKVVDMRLLEGAPRVGDGQGVGQLEDCLKETDCCLLFRVRFAGCARPVISCAQRAALSCL